MKPFEEGTLIGEALAEFEAESPSTEEELREGAALLAGYLTEDEETQRTLAAGIRYGMMPKE